jgi:hypothetical protein
MFGKAEVPKDATAEKEAKPEKPKKPEVVMLVDPKRSNNINICLGRFRMSHEALRDAILAMDESVIPAERIQALITCAPTQDEVDTVMHYEVGSITLASVNHYAPCRCYQHSPLFLR